MTRYCPMTRTDSGYNCKTDLKIEYDLEKWLRHKRAKEKYQALTNQIKQEVKS